MVPSRPAQRILLLLALSIGAYLPALQLPFIADDYHQIPIARYDAAAGWQPLLHDVALRTRATYMFLSAALDRTFGFEPGPFYAASIALHAACVVMLYLLCVWRAVPRTAAFLAAGFFAIQEGHQEAVMWLAASHDLIVFAFGMAALVAWVKWLESDAAGFRPGWYATSMACFLVAMISKETFFVFALLMLAITIWERRSSSLIGALTALSPFLLISAAYLAFMWTTRVAGPTLDARFALSGTWINVLWRGFWDLMFPYGLISLGILALIRRRGDRFLIGFALLWIMLGIAPHSFLTYMPRLASRHTYLASAGLALLFGTAFARLSKRTPRIIFATLLMIVAAANLEILWVKKMSQFKERAEPTELLKAAAFAAQGPIKVDCTPIPDVVVEDALRSIGTSALFTKPENHSQHCFAIEYQDRAGAIVRVNRRIGRQHGAFY